MYSVPYLSQRQGVSGQYGNATLLALDLTRSQKLMCTMVTNGRHYGGQYGGQYGEQYGEQDGNWE